MLIDRNQLERLSVPHELGEWVDIRALTGAEMDRASDVMTEKALKQFGDSLEAIMNVSSKKTEATTQNRKQGYDPTTLLNCAVAAWSYHLPVSRDSIELLDAITREWLWEQIVERNTRPPANANG